MSSPRAIGAIKTPSLAPAPAEPVAVLVLGMHRSGTSAFTGVMQHLGIPVPGELLPAESYNQKGIFENKALNLFHNRLLELLKSSWDDFLPLSPNWLDTPVGRQAVVELSELIKGELIGEGVFAVKDPRMCRLVPLWTRAMQRLQGRVIALHPIRHPLEVAGSLLSRDGFPQAKSLLLWLEHVLASERATRGMTRSFIAYDLLMRDWRAAARKIETDLGLVYPYAPSRAEDQIDAFLTAELRHHAHRDQLDDREPLRVLAQQVWTALNRLCDDAGDAEARTLLEASAAELERGFALLGPQLDWGRRTVARLKAELSEQAFLAGELRTKLSDAEQVRAEAAWLKGELEKRTALADEHFHQMVEARRQTDEVRRETDEARRETDMERSARHLAETESRRLAERLAYADSENTRLQSHAHELGLRLAEATAQAASLAAEREALLSSASWRVTLPLRVLAERMPPSTRTFARRSAKAAWWAVTPWRIPARLQFMRDRAAAQAVGVLTSQPAVAGSPAALLPPASSTKPSITVAETLRRRLQHLGPLNVFPVPGQAGRLTLVTDSINAGSLYGGVGTALVFGALLAAQRGMALRIVTRTEPPDRENVGRLYAIHGVEEPAKLDFAFVSVNDANHQLDVAEDDIFLTTSWWTTYATKQSIPAAKIIYLLQEDERMFYPYGDDHLRCSETISDPSLRYVINTRLLHGHLVGSGLDNIAAKGIAFEPSFPLDHYHYVEAEREKLNFFFYARPNNVRNLYYRGLEAIQAAVDRGVLDPTRWNIHFVGKDVGALKLTDQIRPIVLENLAWSEYTDLMRRTDLGLSLMYTPHPSYPPLDLAASGAVAVTNRFGPKTSLEAYSKNIICVDDDIDSLVEGIRAGVALATDKEARRRNYEQNGLGRDWSASFAPVLKKLAEG